MESDIAQALARTRQRVLDACLQAQGLAHRPDEGAQGPAPAQAHAPAVAQVLLLAVSKTQGAQAVRSAHEAGQRHFGENYVQEAMDKMRELAALRGELVWHLIGPLQSNKTREVAGSFDWVHSVDRLKVAQRLSDQRPAILPPLQVCLQVNISGEPSKSGVPPSDAAALALQVARLPRLRLRGLMSIPEPAQGLEAQRAPHRALRQLLHDINAALLAASLKPMDTLSMGMSADLEAAIAEGSTLVRVGTAIFGERAGHAQPTGAT